MGDGGRYVNVILMLANGRGSRCPQGKDLSIISSDAQYSFVRDDRYVLSHRITYHTQGGEKRRVGGGWDDPFARALTNAHAHAHANTNANTQPTTHTHPHIHAHA